MLVNNALEFIDISKKDYFQKFPVVDSLLLNISSSIQYPFSINLMNLKNELNNQNNIDFNIFGECFFDIILK